MCTVYNPVTDTDVDCELFFELDLVTEDLCNMSLINIEGELHSVGHVIDGISRIYNSIYVKSWSLPTSSDVMINDRLNGVTLKGTICKSVFSYTPGDSYTMIAVPRGRDRTDYVPIIFRNIDCENLQNSEVGTEVHVFGYLTYITDVKTMEGLCLRVVNCYEA